eukprot:2376584-Rhodomonas_salina.1
MSEWPVVGLALLAASMASVLVLLAVHGAVPDALAFCTVKLGRALTAIATRVCAVKTDASGGDDAGPEGQAGCSVSKSVWSNANMTKQGKKSRRRFLWLLRDSSWYPSLPTTTHLYPSSAESLPLFSSSTMTCESLVV